MKIGILTLPLHTNYGGILQAYALQTVLERMGHEVVVIEKKKDYRIPLWKVPLSYTKRIIEKFIFRKKVRLFAEKYDRLTWPIVTKNTQLFIDNYIHISKINDFDELKNIGINAIVVGSDQIWRPLYCKNIEDSFLKFAKDWKIKRIAYAASFGNSDWEFSSRQTKNCMNLLNLFDIVSVREKSGCNLCKRYLNHDAHHVLDPTLLLRKDDYLKLLNPSEKKNEKKLMVYILDGKTDTWSKILKISKKSGLTPFKANSNFEDYFAPIEQRVQPPVEEWIKCFIESDVILTDSFHACVFSIIFEKDFFVIGNMKRGKDRFISLLELFGLSDRLFESIDDINLKALESIDYERVNRQLKELREKSIYLLKEGLSYDK